MLYYPTFHHEYHIFTDVGGEVPDAFKVSGYVEEHGSFNCRLISAHKGDELP